MGDLDLRSATLAAVLNYVNMQILSVSISLLGGEMTFTPAQA